MGLLRSDLLSTYPEIGHAFSTRAGGNLASATGVENRRLLCEAAGAPFPPAIPRQVLGSDVVTLDELAREADAVVTAERGRSTLTLSADCVLVLLYDPAHRAIGNVHSSRHGARGEIAKKALARMSGLYGTRPADVVAAIGPSIGPCCYEVREDIVKIWRGFGDRFLLDRGGRIHLDLWSAVRAQLEESGVTRIDSLDLCTKCHPELFFSYRRDGEKTGRFGALLWLNR